MAFWKRDKKSRNKENNGSVKIVSELGEELGELRFIPNKHIENHEEKSTTNERRK